VGVWPKRLARARSPRSERKARRGRRGPRRRRRRRESLAAEERLRAAGGGDCAGLFANEVSRWGADLSPSIFPARGSSSCLATPGRRWRILPAGPLAARQGCAGLFFFFFFFLFFFFFVLPHSSTARSSPGRPRAKAARPSATGRVEADAHELILERARRHLAGIVVRRSGAPTAGCFRPGRDAQLRDRRARARSLRRSSTSRPILRPGRLGVACDRRSTSSTCSADRRRC